MEVDESVIRRMTRLAVRHHAINLAQGFTDEAPPFPMVWEAVLTLLGGTGEEIERLRGVTIEDLGPSHGEDGGAVRLEDALASLASSHDRFSQYSFPCWLPELRDAIADYTARWWGFCPDPETETTVMLGATEGLASVFAGACHRGDGVIIL